MAVYGYARVSTEGQSLSAQLAELKTAKCQKIFKRRSSGARSDRKQLMRLMGSLTKGDTAGSHPTRSIGEVDARSTQPPGDDC